MERLRAIRAEHGLGRRPSPPRASDRSEPTHGVANDIAAGDVMEDPMAIKYALELAAHRETTQRLLAEKDRTIATLGELIAELRSQLAAGGELAESSSTGDAE